MIRSMLRTCRAIRTWSMLKHDTAAQLGEPRVELERALAKHLLDCGLLFLLRCKLMVAYLIEALEANGPLQGSEHPKSLVFLA